VSSPPRQPVRLRSVFEPEHPDSYFRPPGSNDRLVHYENRLGMNFTLWDERSRQAPQAQAWNETIDHIVSRQCKSIRAYLRWRMQRYQQEHPDAPPPAQAILIVRVYRTPRAGENARPVPLEKTVARWRPGAGESPRFLPIEASDARDDSFH